MSFSTSFNTHQHNGRLWLLAICAGLSVANVYELQPGLSLVRSEFGVSAVSVGWLPSLSQMGYALGMLLLAPLGDVLPRRKMIQTKAVLLMFALIGAAVSPSFAWLATVSMCIGMLGSLGQDFVPIAAQWAADQGRGRAIGIVTTGLLSGILLSRTLGGWLAQACGWRVLQWVASGLMLVVLLIARHIVPDVPPATHARYRTLLVSLWTLWRQHLALRLAVVTQALLASTLGAFWSTLALVLAEAPFHLGAGVAGSYGIAGAAGALAASWFGRFADCHGPLFAIRIGCGLVIVAFLGMQLLPLGLLTLVKSAWSARPYLQPKPGDDQPLTVLCSLLSRADNTPLGERRRAEGHVLNHAGQVIADPAADAGANAFEGNPNLNFEHWGEYWRKVHGVRFIHAEEPDDQSLDRLLRYDQLHRFAPGPTHTDAPPYRAPADAQGKLWPGIIGDIKSYRRPRWDGIAYLAFTGPEDIAEVLGNARVREKILPEDQTIFRDIAPVLSRQYVIVPSATGNEALTLVKLHVRSASISRDVFQQWWRGEHAAMATAQSKRWVSRYVQLHNIGPIEPGQPLYHPQTSSIDGVTLMGFASLNDLEDFLRSDTYQMIAEDEARMTNVSAGEWWTTIGMTLVNRIAPECATDLRA